MGDVKKNTSCMSKELVQVGMRGHVSVPALANSVNFLPTNQGHDSCLSSSIGGREYYVKSKTRIAV